MELIFFEDDVEDTVGMKFKDIPLFATMTADSEYRKGAEIYLKINTTLRTLIFTGDSQFSPAIGNQYAPAEDAMYYNINRFNLIDTTYISSFHQE